MIRKNIINNALRGEHRLLLIAGLVIIVFCWFVLPTCLELNQPSLNDFAKEEDIAKINQLLLYKFPSEYEKAIVECKKMLKIYSKDDKLYHLLSLAYREKYRDTKNPEDIQMAIDNGKKSLELNPKSLLSFWALSNYYLEINEFEKAREQCKKMLEIPSGNKMAGAQLEIIENSEKEYKEKTKEYKEKNREMQKLLTEGNFNILKERKKYVSEHPDDAKGYYRLAEIYWGLSIGGDDEEKVEEAIKALKKAIKLSPGLTLVKFRAHVLICTMIKDHDKSIEWDEKRRAIEKEWYEKEHWETEEYVRRKRENEKETQEMENEILKRVRTKEKFSILEERKKYVSEHPDDPRGYLSLAKICWELSGCGIDKEKLDEAVKTTKRAIDLDPNSEDGYILMVHIFMDEREFNKAIEWCEIGLKQTGSELLLSKLKRLKRLKKQEIKRNQEIKGHNTRNQGTQY